MTSTNRFESNPMRTIAFASFPQEEQDNFRSSCKRWRKRPEEFLVEAEELDPGPESVAPMREVIVVHHETGKGRRYTDAGGTNWNNQFDDDLQAAYFREPLRRRHAPP